MSFMDFQDIDFTKVRKFSHRGKFYAMVFRSLENRDRLIQAMETVCFVKFNLDFAPDRPGMSGAKVGATGVVANLHGKSVEFGESFGDYFRLIAESFDKLDMEPAGEDNPFHTAMTLSFILFDVIHEYVFLPWEDWVMINRFWSEDKKRRQVKA